MAVRNLRRPDEQADLLSSSPPSLSLTPAPLPARLAQRHGLLSTRTPYHDSSRRRLPRTRARLPRPRRDRHRHRPLGDRHRARDHPNRGRPGPRLLRGPGLLPAGVRHRLARHLPRDTARSGRRGAHDDRQDAHYVDDLFGDGLDLDAACAHRHRQRGACVLDGLRDLLDDDPAADVDRDGFRERRDRKRRLPRLPPRLPGVMLPVVVRQAQQERSPPSRPRGRHDRHHHRGHLLHDLHCLHDRVCPSPRGARLVDRVRLPGDRHRADADHHDDEHRRERGCDPARHRPERARRRRRTAGRHRDGDGASFDADRHADEHVDARYARHDDDEHAHCAGHVVRSEDRLDAEGVPRFRPRQEPRTGRPGRQAQPVQGARRQVGRRRLRLGGHFPVLDRSLGLL